MGARILFLAALIGIGALTGTASAAPITYSLAGYGAGSLDGLAFGSSAFTITGQADTDNVQILPLVPCPNCMCNENISASISIAGLGTFDFITPTRFFVYDVLVGFSRGGTWGLDLYNGPAGGQYDLISDRGPFMGSGTLLQWTNSPVETSGGVLVFDGATVPTPLVVFTARLGSVTVPEPATWSLFGLGLLGAVIRRRKRADN